MGSVSSVGQGGKLLRGDGALEKYLAETKLPQTVLIECHFLNSSSQNYTFVLSKN